MFKRFFSFALIALLFTPLLSGVAFAVESTTVADEAPLTDAQTRRLVLAKIFALTEEEIRDLRSRLASLEQPADEEFMLVSETLQSELKSHLALIEGRLKELESSYTTLDGVRVIADTFKKWRETVYDPGTREIFDFLVLSQGEEIFSIAEVRYGKVVSDVEKLVAMLEPAKAVQLQQLLTDAHAKLTNAQVLRDKSRELFLANFRTRHPGLESKFEKIARRQAEANAALTASVIDGVVAPTATVMQTAKPKTILDTLDMTKETVQTLMKRAVDQIAETYKLFLQMRDVVRGL